MTSLVGLTSINVRDHFGVVGNNDPGDNAKLQLALDTAPFGAQLVIPTDIYPITTPLLASRFMDIDLQKAGLVGHFTNPLDDVLRISVSDCGYFVDNRNMQIVGGCVNATDGGRAAIAINTVGSPKGTNNLTVRDGSHQGNTAAIIMESDLTQYAIIERNSLGGGIRMIGVSDGNRIEKNTIFGTNTAIVIDTVPGAYKTQIRENTLVSRDGALRVINGSQIDFEHNTIEQPTAGNQLHASIKIEGTTRIASGINIGRNNFGNSADADNPHIWLQNTEETIIDDNDFHIRNPSDIKIDAGSKWTRIGPRNRVKGIRTGDPTEMLLISDAGVGTFGAHRAAAYLGPQHGWTASSDFMFFKDLSGRIQFRGWLKGGTTASGTVIGTMPVGFRPANQVSQLMYDSNSGAQVMLVVVPENATTLSSGTAGQIVCGSIPAGALLVLEPISFYSKWKTDYQAGP